MEKNEKLPDNQDFISENVPEIEENAFLEPVKDSPPVEKVEFATKLALKHDLGILLNKGWEFIKSTLSIEGVNVEGTTEEILQNMRFQGHMVWILIISIVIASIGLNVNSAAVVIGAMLISPLMGPIIGVGLSIGTNDWDTMTRSMKNLFVTVAISILTSYIYFMISPFKEASPELLARTKPTILDVLLALAGGAAGIIVGARREKSNVVPGVAIATALMPPLCTVGYGLATAQWNFFWGALILFFINSAFISGSTWAVVKFLKFPKKVINEKMEQKIRIRFAAFILLATLPSIKIFIDVLNESRYYANADAFISQNFKFDNTEIINSKITFSDSLSSIDLYIIGEELPDTTIARLKAKLPEFEMLEKGTFLDYLFIISDSTALRIHQSRDNLNELAELDTKLDKLSSSLSSQLRVGILEDIYQKNEQLLKTKEEKIRFLEDQLIRYKEDSLPLNAIRQEIKIQYPEIKKFAFAKTIESNFDADKDSTLKVLDTIPTFMIQWQPNVYQGTQKQIAPKLANWLKVRLDLDTVRVISY